MPSERKFFGTDGVRGRVGTYPITPEFVMKLGYAAGTVLGRAGRNAVLIGKDTRISGYMFESALEAGLSAAGVDILLLGPMPTPGIAYLTRTFNAAAGIVISASHNAYEDNGIKFFGPDGEKLPDEVELAIEQAMEQPMTVAASAHLGKARRVEDAAGRYIEFCKSTIGARSVLQGLKLVVDCAHGATYHIAPAVFRELGAEVIAVGAEPNGLNINAERGATDTRYLREQVLAHGADLGVALDGDGDRLMMVDHAGELVDGDELVYVIARERRGKAALQGAVVGTLMSNLGLEQAIRTLGLEFKRAKVGDRYILEMLRANGWTLGGESSGHILCMDLTSTGDAVVCALQVLEAVVRTGLSLHELKLGMTKYPQHLVNVRLPRRLDVIGLPPVQHAVAAVESELGKQGRVLLRPSGTEPVVRVMVEGRDTEQVERLAGSLAAAVGEAIEALNTPVELPVAQRA